MVRALLRQLIMCPCRNEAGRVHNNSCFEPGSMCSVFFHFKIKHFLQQIFSTVKRGQGSAMTYRRLCWVSHWGRATEGPGGTLPESKLVFGNKRNWKRIRRIQFATNTLVFTFKWQWNNLVLIVKMITGHTLGHLYMSQLSNIPEVWVVAVKLLGERLTWHI